MKHYRWLCIFSAAALSLEFIVGFGGMLTPRGEVFPFASWALFAIVPHRTTEFDLVFHAEGGRAIAPPVSFSYSGGMVRQPHSIVAYQLIQQLGGAQQGHDDARVAMLRRQIEAQFTVPFLHYELARLTYAPIERWETGKVRDSQPVASFVAGEF